MITVYSLQNKILKIDVDKVENNQHLPEDTIWLDVVDPSDEERTWLDQYFVEEMPDTEDLNELEATSRFYKDKDGTHIHSFFPHRQGKDLKNISVSFNLRPHILITLRDEDIGLFRLVRNQLKQRQVNLDSPILVLTALFTAKVDYLADQLEDVYATLESLSKDALLNSDPENHHDQDSIVKEITIQEDFNGKIRLNLLDSQRSLRYLLRSRWLRLSDNLQQEIMEMLRDIDSLLPHTAFIFNKINFLLEAVMGLINLEQNKIIKIFSVAATIFMPPTLIASSYGMNFHIMPELDWAFGYPLAIGLMVCSALSTYLFFKRKKWL